MSAVDNEGEDSDGWDEIDDSGEQTTCLFCSLQFPTISEALDHCRSEHNFDLLVLKNKYKMDCYSYIKMINYVRLWKPAPNVLQESSTAIWDDDIYLKPGEMETWLMYDFENLEKALSVPQHVADRTAVGDVTFLDLQRQVQELTLQIQSKDMLLENCLNDMKKMKAIARTIIACGDDEENRNSCNMDLQINNSNDYFNSYSHFGIHHEMLNDKLRTESYRDAILNNSMLFSGKTVLDVGCGTGILSMFSARAGAQHVIGIDQSEVIYKAMDIIRENNLQDKIFLIKGQIENTQIPVEEIDIIVSEWMGYFLLFEGMLESFIYARDTYLKPDGLVLPSRCSISIIGICDMERYNNVIGFWDNIYGFSMKCMKSEVLKEASIETVVPEKVITDAAVVMAIDLKTCTINSCCFNSKFTLRANKDGTLTAIAGYFDTYFDLDNKVHFSTGPYSRNTHWQQTVFFLKETVAVKEGELIDGTLSCTKLTKNSRGLSVEITVGKNRYQYFLD